MNGELCLRNRQRTRPVDVRLFRRIARGLLADFIGPERFELCVHLVGHREMTRLNETFLRHAGSTDVITFDHASSDGRRPASTARLVTRNPEPATSLHGEIFICVDEALIQSRRFRTTWQRELVRYLIHGTLHLCGHDDRLSSARRRMKREENRLLRELSRRFALSRLARAARQP